MKRKLLIGLLALTGGVAVVGSGFSAWYFGETSLPSANKSVNVYVTDMASDLGDLKDNNTGVDLYVVLDQGTYANKKDETKGISINSVTQGGTISDTNLGTQVSKLGATYTISKESAAGLVTNNIKSGTFSAVLKLSSAAAEYLEFKTTYTGITPTAKTGDVSVTVSEIKYSYTISYENVTADIEQEFAIDVSTTDYVNSLLQYKENKKPTDTTTYNEMKNALSGEILTVAYSFSANL